MIGDRYWSTGIVIGRAHDGRWAAVVEFFDDGWCEDNSTEGEVRSRYHQDDIAALIAAVVADTAALGIEWENPTVFVEDEDGAGCAIKPEANRQATRLGWRHAYPNIELQESP